MKNCQNCGTQLQDHVGFCTSCGAQQPIAQTPPPTYTQNVQYNTYVAPAQPQGKRIEKWVAFLLCFFLGYFGVHRFYEGKIGTGVLYMLTGGLFGIGWLIDTIIILTKSDPYYV